ncbi:hypothetical protein B0H12DRAFT_1282703 [Mycena haematopus]|nr:hypothetical protein B0H12DRAFT_1282703 [Mycena haematopus]
MPPPSYSPLYSPGSPRYLPSSSPSSTRANATELNLSLSDNAPDSQGPYTSTGHYYPGDSVDPDTDAGPSPELPLPQYFSMTFENDLGNEMPTTPIRISRPIRPMPTRTLPAIPTPQRSPSPVPNHPIEKPKLITRVSNGLREGYATRSIPFKRPRNTPRPTVLTSPAPPVSISAVLSPDPVEPAVIAPHFSPLWDPPFAITTSDLEKAIQSRPGVTIIVLMTSSRRSTMTIEMPGSRNSFF